VKRKPTNVAYLNDLGFALIQAGRKDEGLFRLRQGLELAPGDVLVRNNLIVALRKAGRDDEASGLVETIKSPVERRAAQSLLATVAASAPAASRGDAQ
jgi:Flp pilus assembly protein TadD